MSRILPYRHWHNVGLPYLKKALGGTSEKRSVSESLVLEKESEGQGSHLCELLALHSSSICSSCLTLGTCWSS